MRFLTVLYDGACPLCERCRDFLVASRQRIPLRLVDCRSDEARRAYGRIPGLGRELVVVDDEGRFWVGPAAFILCLWALEHFAGLASAMLCAPLRPIALATFAWISANRRIVGHLLGAPTCSGAHCGVAHAHAGPYR